MQQETHDFLTLGKLEEARGETLFKSLALLHVSCVLENQAGVIQIPPCHQPGWGWGGQSETLNRLLQYLDCQEVPGSLWKQERLNSSHWGKGIDLLHPSSGECGPLLFQHGELRGWCVSGPCLGEPGQPQSGRLSCSLGPVPSLHALLPKPQQQQLESPT